MARMPQADWLGEHAPVQSDGKRRTMDRYDCVVVHTIVGFAPAHAAHLSVHQGGTIQQSRDTKYQSGANLEGNHRVIAIENEDHGSAFPSWNTRDGHAVPALTDAQVEANAQILAWAHTEHGVPLQLCPDSRPGSRGLAYHRQGIDGNWSGYKYGGRVSGGETWTTSPGKVCPGDRRIDQLPAILARAKQIVGEDDDMDATERKMLAELHHAVTAPIRPNSYMAEKWDIPDEGYTLRVYARTGGYAWSRRGAESSEQAVAELAAVRAEQAAQRELLVQLAAAQTGVTLNDEQVEQLASRIADAGQGACDQVLERLASAGDALDGDDTDS